MQDPDSLTNNGTRAPLPCELGVLATWTTKEDPKKLFILKIFKSTEKLQLQGHKLPYILYPDSPTIDVLPYLLFLYTHTHCYLLSFWCDNLNQLQAL